jgi:HsdM N-terminal domain
MGRPRKQASTNGATLGFEATLWAAADKLRSHMDASEYKHVVLRLVFLKYISDAFDRRRAELQAEVAQGAERARGRRGAAAQPRLDRRGRRLPPEWAQALRGQVQGPARRRRRRRRRRQHGPDVELLRHRLPAIVPRRFGDTGLFSHHLHRVRPKASSPLSPTFIYLMLLPGRLRTEVAGYATELRDTLLPKLISGEVRLRGDGEANVA